MENKAVICILHFQPLEKYPPVMNLLDYLGENAREGIYVVSRKNNSGGILHDYKSAGNKVHQFRTGIFSDKGPLRLINYFLFYTCAFIKLVKFRPVAVLYYESLSSWPALWYKKLAGGKVKLMAHYHEYNTPYEFNHSMKLVKWQHRAEAVMYAKYFDWISHTNEVRLAKFITDQGLGKSVDDKLHLMPNYPGKKWLSKQSAMPVSGKKRLVYVGSLGYENMYVEELIRFVKENKEVFSLDIYSYNIHLQVKQMLNELDEENIRYHGGCNYYELPLILRNYDIGLVIYKSFSENWVNAVSNKVFEYLACGLDVWFSKDMAYTMKYLREDRYPKIIPVDFSNLSSFDFRRAIDRSGLAFEETSYFYENIYNTIYQKMTADEK